MTEKNEWMQIKVRTDKSCADTVSDLLEQLGALSITFEDAEDSPILEPRPGERRLWPATEVSGLFAQGSDPVPILKVLKAILGDHIPMAAVNLQDRNWIREWMSQFKPIKCGNRLWICPSWLHVDEKDAVTVMLDPGLAFGTGTHPTTWLCLNFLDSIDLKGKSVVDYGCGSGILGIAALKLGAAKASGVDIDDQAILASDENAKRNGVKGLCTLYLNEAAADVAPADVTVANILAGPLAELEPQIARLTASGGILALSGVLIEQAQTVKEVYEKDFLMGEIRTRGDWALLSGVRR